MVGYGISLIGTSHEQTGAVCQDAHIIKELKNGITLVCVADGVGSCKHSDIASLLACRAVADFMLEQSEEGFAWNDEIITELLPQAYKQANYTIQEYVKSKRHKVSEYDTTLTVVLYNGENIYYGHSGDGGIIGLTVDGDYVAVTKPQKDTDGICVIPLRAGEKTWEFGTNEHKFASILLATDGIYDTFFPYLLQGELYKPLIRFFMDNGMLKATPKNIGKIKQQVIDFLISDGTASITDDKTVAVVINEKITPKAKPKKFYDEPDWEKLKAKWFEKAYPHLVKKGDR